MNMTIYRKILKVKTQGSRAKGNLQPAWEMAQIMPGVSTVVHEYNEKEGWCICEVWCSDHEGRGTKRSKAELDSLDTHESVIGVLTSHPLSPTIIGRVHRLSSDPTIETVDKENKEIKHKGKEKKIKFKREHKMKDTGGKEITKYILDEG